MWETILTVAAVVILWHPAKLIARFFSNAITTTTEVLEDLLQTNALTVEKDNNEVRVKMIEKIDSLKDVATVEDVRAALRNVKNKPTK